MSDQDLWRKNLPDDWQGKMADEWDGEIPLKPIFWSAAAVAIAVFVAFVINAWLIGAWDGAQEVRQSPLVEARERFEHVDPKLQASPEAELTEMKEAEAERMSSYGWVDQLDERIHLPVERAMDLVLADNVGQPATIEPGQDAPVDIDASGDMPGEAEEADSAGDSSSEDHGTDH